MLRILAWLLLLGLAIVTLGPIQVRPITPFPVTIERSGGLAIIGFVFALAYPRHLVLVGLLLIGASALLEALQVLEPSRHGRVVDFLVKAAGAVIGLGAGWLVARAAERRQRTG
jgi:VanZ family protein